MSFGRTRIFSLLHLSIALFLGVLLGACLDIPNAPDSDRRVTSIKVHTIQNGVEDSTLLKINPMDSVLFQAVVTPSSAAGELTYSWFLEDELLSEGRSYGTSPESGMDIPDRLVVKDKNGNKQEVRIQIIENRPPVLSNTTVPTDGDTVYASKNSPVTFSWLSKDFNGDVLKNVLVIDGTSYPVGPLNQVVQSGFEPGKHTLSIIVEDVYGEVDSIPTMTFYVVDTLEVHND